MAQNHYEEKRKRGVRTRIVTFVGFLVPVIIGMWLGTQRVATQLHYDKALGAGIVQLGGYTLYAPWEIVRWHFEFGDSISHHTSQGSNFIFWGGIVGVILVVPLSLILERRRPPRGIHGSATWASGRDIQNYGLLKGKGVFLGQLSDGRYLRHEGPDHYAVIAPTRSGKGAGVIIPTLLTWGESAVIYDLKGELWNTTAGHRAKSSHVIYFNPNSTQSAHFNPLLEVRKGPLEVRDVQNIADMIVDPDGSGFSDHWVKTGHSLLVAAILHILYAGNAEDKTLAGVARFLSNPERKIEDTLRDMLHAVHYGEGEESETKTHPVVSAAARDMLNKSDNERSGVLSTAMSFLTLYRDPIVAHNTRDSDFRIDDLMDAERPVSLYVAIPPSDTSRLRPLFRLLLNQLCRRLTEEHSAGKRKHRLLLLLDEFPTLGKIDFFETSLGFLAGYGIKTMLVCQSINQLRKTYGQSNSILDNTHVRLFFAPNTIETAEYLSRSLGQATVQYETEGDSGKKISLWLSNRNVSTHVSGRPLMTAGEVLELPEREALLLVGGKKPIRCEKVRYYADGSFQPLLLDAPELREGRPYPYAPPARVSEWLQMIPPSVTYEGGVLYRRLELELVEDESPASAEDPLGDTPPGSLSQYGNHAPDSGEELGAPIESSGVEEDIPLY